MDIQLKKGILDLLVLNILAKNDAYGYDIYQSIKHELNISESTIYPILRKMVKEGYLDTYLEASPDGPPRKYFTLTKTGKARYKKLCEGWTTFKDSIERLLKEV